jgi:hypothetical protein
MPRTPYLAGASGLSSMLSLATVTRSPSSFADLLERRSDHPAGAAPFRPEIDEDGLVRADDVVVEAGVGDGLGAMAIS